jgi:lysophospholipase L1-like esterase
MKPLRTLLFTLGVFLLLAGTMLITPENGVKVGSFTFHMPTFTEMLMKENSRYADVSEIIKNQFDIDDLIDFTADSVDSNSAEIIKKASYDSLAASIYKIGLTDAGRQNLNRFFKSLHDKSQVRIMHYGDSQIEDDRITSFLRYKFQEKFGGNGPGLRPALQPYDYTYNAIQKNSANWVRYPILSVNDSLILHDRYGVMAAYSRYAPQKADSLGYLSDSMFYEAEIDISKSNISFKQTQIYENFRLFYGNAKKPVLLQLLVKGEVYMSEMLHENLDYAVVGCELPDSVDQITLKFSGYDSPDIYGIELASRKGVIFDNIALRGNSGLIFTRTDFQHSLKMFNDLKPDLFILQFGGNVMPYIKDEAAINNYGRAFKSQILRLQQQYPGAAIVVIGPSDMSTKEKDKYVTYEHLPLVVEALKEAALSTGCGYWNMYEAMGGFNSMPSWVNAVPELARPDYVHFSALGARLIANMFYNALIFEYNKYISQPN